VKLGDEDASFSFIARGDEAGSRIGAAQTSQRVASAGTLAGHRGHLGITGYAYDDWLKILSAGAILYKIQSRLNAHRLPCIIETA
jgi:hypothetical protein